MGGYCVATLASMRRGKAVGLPINLLPPLLRMSKAYAGFDAALAASVSRVVKPAAGTHVTFSEALSDPWQGCLSSLIRLEHVGSAGSSHSRKPNSSFGRC
ncbi:unnamed protein product [Effrenium voratum]|nr:unnamed protein product [Effrenium voratum]